MGSTRQLGEREFVADAFRRHSKRLGRDAAADRRSAVCLAALATAIGIAGATAGAVGALQDGHDLGVGVVVALMFLGASLPVWWLADRYRRSGDESRRLQKHTALFVPFVDGLREDERERLMGSLAQTLFARSVEDADPMRLVSWPTTGDRDSDD